MESARDIMFSKETLNKILTPVPINFNPTEKYKNNSMHFAMNAGIEISRGGRLFSCWIGGEDGAEAYLICTYSDNGGETWKDMQLVIDPHSDDVPYSLNTHVGGLWLDPLGRLWLFYQQSFGMWDGTGAVFAIVCEEPDASVLTWSEPRYVSPGAIIKKPIVLSNGEWLVPVSIWERWHISNPLGDCNHEYDAIRGANVFASCDNGKTWERRGGIAFEDSCFNEHSIVELKDGKIMMISRCDKCIKRSFSCDGGRTWSAEEEYFKHLASGSSMASLRRLKSGNLLLVKHGMSMEHITNGRSHLTAFISKDDGETFEGGLLLDMRDAVSYPDICEAADGTIYVQYDYNRAQEAHLLFARFKESDVISKEFKSKNSATAQLITSHKGITGTQYTLFDGASNGFLNGCGTKEEPYVIGSVGEFIYMSKRVYEGEKFVNTYFEQGNTLDFGGKEMVPVGAFGRPFAGVFDGKGHCIKNFKQTGAYVLNRGVFGCISGAVIKNVNVENAKIYSQCNASAIVGNSFVCENNSAIIENCTVAEDVFINAYTNVGGIIGLAQGEVQIANCKCFATLNIPRTTDGNDIFAGGIAGRFKDKITVAECEFYGSIAVKHAVKARIGGIVGGEGTATIKNCNASGKISLDLALDEVTVGNIGGKILENSTVENCNSDNSLLITRADNSVVYDVALFCKGETRND